jgi:serine protease Do
VLRGLVVIVALVGVQAGLVTPTLSARLDVLPLSADQVDKSLELSTVEIVALGCDLAQRQGTAVAIGGGRLLTNQHVVGTFRSLDVAANAEPVANASVALINRTVDVAVITAEAVGAPPIAFAGFDPQPGESVWLAGFPHGPPPTGAVVLDDGLVVVPTHVVDDGHGTMRLDAPATPGMSGGPVLDRSGHLAGLVYGVQSPTNDALVVPASVLRAVIAGGLTAGAAC